MSSKLSRWYVGGPDQVEVVLLDGSSVVVNRGEHISVEADDAERFDQTPDNWAKSAPKAAEALSAAPTTTTEGVS